MQTYMDGLFVNAAKSLRRDGFDDDLRSVADAIIEFWRDESTASTLKAPYDWTLMFCAFLADAVGDPTILKDFERTPPPRQYFKVSRNLVADLFAAPPPETPYMDWFGEFLSPDDAERITYIDIAPGSVSLRGMDLRQISISSFPAGIDGNPAALMIQGLVAAKDRSPYIPDIFSLFESAERLGEIELPHQPEEFLVARRQVVNFIRCFGLYLRDRRDSGVALPLAPRIDPKTRPKHGRDLNKTRSLFTIYELQESVRSAAEQRAGRDPIKLGHQVEVRGHWRWQAWGEKHSLRKLLWIDGHVRGVELPKLKPRMEYLRT